MAFPCPTAATLKKSASLILTHHLKEEEPANFQINKL